MVGSTNNHHSDADQAINRAAFLQALLPMRKGFLEGSSVLSVPGVSEKAPGPQWVEEENLLE